jgi:hypothetical protein
LSENILWLVDGMKLYYTVCVYSFFSSYFNIKNYNVFSVCSQIFNNIKVKMLFLILLFCN